MASTIAGSKWVLLNSRTQRTFPPRAEHSCVLWESKDCSDHKDGCPHLVVFGGEGEKSVLNDVWQFQVCRKTWEELSCKGEVCIFSSLLFSSSSLLEVSNQVCAIGSSTPVRPYECDLEKSVYDSLWREY